MQSIDMDYQNQINEQNLFNSKRKKVSTPPKSCQQPETLKESNKVVKNFQKKTSTPLKSYFNLGDSPFLATKESSKPEDSATGYKEKANDAI